MAPQRAKMDKNAENCPKNIFSQYFLFIVAFFSALGSFCTIPHYPSSYNTVDTILDPSKMAPKRTKMDKNTQKCSRNEIFFLFIFIIVLSVALGSFCTIPHHPSSYNTVDTILDPSKMAPQRRKNGQKHPKMTPK